MSNSAYRETFLKIKKVKESNLSLLNTMIQSVATFTGKITKLLHNLDQISNELPTKKAKKRSYFFRQDNDEKYEFYDQDFTSTWATITKAYVSKPRDIEELSDLMREFFIEKLKLVQDSYIDSNKTLESSFQVYLRDFDEIKDKYNKAIQNYKSLHNRIEQLDEKLKPENINGKNPEYVEKLKSQLSDTKDELPLAEAEAAKSAEAFNEANISFSINSERLLSEFERIDREHEMQMKSVFADFFEKFPTVMDTNTKVESDIKRIANPNNIMQDSQSKNINDYKEILVTPNFQMPRLDISDFIDPSEIFNTEVLQKLATITSDNIHGFPKGTLVVVLYDNGKEATIADVVKYISTVVKKSDIQIENNLRRTINQLKEDYTVQGPDGSFVWKTNEYLLITHHKSFSGQAVWCTDMFGRSAAVPFSKLKQ